MNRFDKDFNDLDPLTSRPFSWGHPDGVWILAIIYSLVSLAASVAVIVGIIKLFSSELSGLGFLLGGTVALFLYLSTVFFLFKRSAQVLYFVLAILALHSMNLVVLSFGDRSSFLVALSFFFAQSYICYYVYELKRDELLR